MVRSRLLSRWDPDSNPDSQTTAVFLGLAHVKYVGVRRPYAGGTRKFGEGVNRLLQSIKKLQTEVVEVNKKVDAFLRKFTGGDFPTVFPEPLPLGIRLPINCDEDIDLNNKLLDTGFQITLIRHLHAEGIGKSSISFLSRIIKILLAPNVAVLYSRLGRKGKKTFMELKHVFKSILTAILSCYLEVTIFALFNSRFFRCLKEKEELHGMLPIDSSQLENVKGELLKLTKKETMAQRSLDRRAEETEE
ncbi:hypothetical protein AVEN_117939-1 [Araneus ventricosus]|uniref:Uncharacterized protein n=1 Tax=Araneus ventricosus TaxID=182803 RepID=A0A4Y2KSD0_ARAVE|nr:hypothetical protein AVEN_117939-1 [Araneus ventricosus]